MNDCPYNVTVIFLTKIVILVKEQMNYTLMPSLERFALIKTAITLWNPDDIIQLIIKNQRNGEWDFLESHVIEKVKELPLPESLKKKVLCFTSPISIEINFWINNDALYDENPIELRSLLRKSFRKICWSSQGTIDQKKTAERLIRDEDLDITKRYKLACHNCLENDILMLWNEMPEDCKKTFYDEKDPRLVEQHPLVVVWTYDIKGEVTRTHCIDIFQNIAVDWPGCTPYQCAFLSAVCSGNKAATEHFLQKQTSEEREESLERCQDILDTLPNNETLCYLLSQMNEVQQIGMFRKHPYEVLKCFLNWPLQGLFMEIAKHVCTFLSPNDYSLLLREIFEKVDDGFKDYDYQKLITEFWQLIPITQKERFISDGILSRLVLTIKDIENFKLILKDIAITDRKKFIFSENGTHICKKLIYADEMNLLEFFVQECISSKDLMIQFREKLEKSYYSKETLERKKDLLNKAFQLLNNLCQKFDERRCVEEGNGPPNL